ncbi:PaaI family thioesterase [Aspergillus ibericus CBS 121593]|uniref:Thioesterase family protein n=1 Tax=Aspergillus ibericus CBS 121593 TaxID=1448316 RepID=A0A395GNH5_9EURO|nr:thioesterase family protein [Aspergillus ibericus CBS 121593]RAK97055.1 thioesterase family protein [Aspergillus ibericus CBS 121593]
MPPVPTMLGSTTISRRLVLAGPLSRLPITAPSRLSVLSRGSSLSPRLSPKAFSTAPADAASSSTPTPPPRSRFRRFVGFTTIAIFAFTAGLVYQTSQTVSRMMTVTLTTDEETLSAFVPHDDFAREVDEYIRTHPLAASLRQNPAFTESRPHMKIPEHLRARTLTGGTLAGPDKIVAPPLVFCEEGGKSLVSLFYLGPSLCGHPGIVHGGLLATLLDEAMGRCCFPALPNKVGVTANLNLDYRKPAMAGNYAVLRAETVKVEGRKAWVEGRIETLPEDGQEPVVLVEAKALFIEPKQAAAMSTLYNITN